MCINISNAFLFPIRNAFFRNHNITLAHLKLLFIVSSIWAYILLFSRIRRTCRIRVLYVCDILCIYITTQHALTTATRKKKSSTKWRRTSLICVYILTTIYASLRYCDVVSIIHYRIKLSYKYIYTPFTRAWASHATIIYIMAFIIRQATQLKSLAIYIYINHITHFPWIYTFHMCIQCTISTHTYVHTLVNARGYTHALPTKHKNVTLNSSKACLFYTK